MLKFYKQSGLVEYIVQYTITCSMNLVFMIKRLMFCENVIFINIFIVGSCVITIHPTSDVVKIESLELVKYKVSW